jgi:hypothetical protein
MVCLRAPRFEPTRRLLIQMPKTGWCGRRDSNPHSLSRSRFSYHLGFRRRLIGVRGLDYHSLTIGTNERKIEQTESITSR